jgi:formaldehyde-activating enzyme involved in methanogenesis
MSKPEKICDYVIHPAASVFPLLEGDRFQSLVDSIAVHGVQNPLVSHEGAVIDGRNRLRAVMKLRDEGHKVDLPFVEWDSKCGLSATEWVASQNLDRRHLSEDAYVAATAAINRILRKEAKERQAKGQAKPGQQSKNPAGRRGKKLADTKSDPPVIRDAKDKNERDTVGQVAKKSGTSRHKAAQAVKLDQAVEAKLIPEEIQKDVIAGKTKLRDAVKQVPAKPEAASKPARKKKRTAGGVLDDLRLLLQEVLSCDQISKQQIVDELTTWIERAQAR